MICFTVPGVPQGKGRPRIATIRGRAMAYTPAKTVAYEGEIARAAGNAMAGAEPYTGAVEIEATCIFEIPASWPKAKRAQAKYHTTRPDVDNVIKAVGDGLNGIVYRDDSQVASVRVVKLYGASAGLHVTVTAL